MSQDIADMPGIEAAMERFESREHGAGSQPELSAQKVPGSDTQAFAPATREPSSPRSDAAETKADAQPTVKSEARPSTPHTGVAKGKQNSATETKSDTPAAIKAGSTEPGAESEQGAQSKEKQTPVPRLQAPDECNKSRYARAQERLEKTWESVNKRKGELDGRTAALEQQRLSLERDKAAFEAVKRQAEAPQHKPEDYAQASQVKRRDADALRMQARRAEDAGKLDEAQKLKKAADKAESLADDLADYAEQIRRNPPVTLQQRALQMEQARKQWTVEAAKAFPDLQKEGSALQQVVAQHLNALATSDPQLLVQPSLVYHICRLADAQIKARQFETVAARVPELEKETEKLRGRIKELETETSPAANGSVARLGADRPDDYGSLRNAAAELGPMFR